MRGLQAAIKNASDGISLTQVAEGAMEEISNILHRMRELAIQSANDSNSYDERTFLQAEVQQLADEISRIAQTTQFNGVNVLDGTYQERYFHWQKGYFQSEKGYFHGERNVSIEKVCFHLKTSYFN